MNNYDQVTKQQLSANQRSLSRLEMGWGNNHVKLLPALNALADLYLVLADCVNAEKLYWRCLSICCKRYGDQHPLVASSLTNLARALHAQGRDDEAERLYRWSLQITASPRIAQGA